MPSTGFCCVIYNAFISALVNPKAVMVDILNEQECDPGLGNANLIIGRIINPVVYGPCTGAKSGEVVRVKISVVNDGSTLGGLHFLSPEGK